jgi:hypothetical protein
MVTDVRVELRPSPVWPLGHWYGQRWVCLENLDPERAVLPVVVHTTTTSVASSSATSASVAARAGFRTRSMELFHRR